MTEGVEIVVRSFRLDTLKIFRTQSSTHGTINALDSVL